MDNNTSLIKRSDSINYLESPILNSFYSIRESYYYYLSLKLVNSKRKFDKIIKKEAIKFIELVNSKEIEDFINSIAYSEIVKLSIHDNREEKLIDIMRYEYTEGFKLLELSEPISFESLKQSYRNAAKKHHPDKGGLTENMKVVNNAYEKFHKLLCLNNIGGIDLEVESEIKSLKDFLCVLHELIININIDNWEIEEAYKWILKYFELEANFSKDNKINLIPILTSLAEKLFIANFINEAEYCLIKAEKYLIIAKKAGLFFDNFVEKAKKIIFNAGKYRIVVTHMEQANNLYKYKIIDEKRFTNSFKKFTINEDEEIIKEDILNQFIAETGFLEKLPADIFDNFVNIENKLIEEPGYFNYNLSELNNEQKTEYKKSFNRNTNLLLVRKYIYVRLHSILKSIILFKELDILESALNEFELLKKIKAPRSSVDNDCNQLIEIIQYFKLLSNTDLIDRINVLAELDSRAIELAETKTDHLTIVNPADIIFSIRLNRQYYDLVKLPLDVLKNGLITGKIEETNEEIKKKESWEVDLKKINELEQKHGGMKLFKILDESKSNPKNVINVLKPYVNDLLDLGEKILNVGELQVMYWVDKLTIAYVRQKDYDKCNELLKRVYNLPEEYWDRSSNLEKISIQKRYEKCLKELQR